MLHLDCFQLSGQKRGVRPNPLEPCVWACIFTDNIASSLSTKTMKIGPLKISAHLCRIKEGSHDLYNIRSRLDRSVELQYKRSNSIPVGWRRQIVIKAAMHYHILYFKWVLCKRRLQLYNCIVQLVLWWPGWDTPALLNYMTSDSFTRILSTSSSPNAFACSSILLSNLLLVI